MLQPPIAMLLVGCQAIEAVAVTTLLGAVLAGAISRELILGAAFIMGVARAFAVERQVVLVLKGQRTVIAFPDGRVWINPTGTPALGTGGSGDILTGLIAGLLSQFPRDPENAILAAVFLHGLAGQIGAADLWDKCLIATDILQYLPNAMENCASLPDRV